MNTKDAVQQVLEDLKITKYRLAQNLGAHPTSVHQWLGRTRMSKSYADKFKELYGISIKDAV